MGMDAVKTAYDPRAPKRPVKLSLNQDLVEKANELTQDLSGEVEALLAQFVARQEQMRDTDAASLRRAAQAWGEFTQKHGSLSDEFCAF